MQSQKGSVIAKFSFYFKLKLLSKYCYILIKNSEGFKENCHIPGNCAIVILFYLNKNFR